MIRYRTATDYRLAVGLVGLALHAAPEAERAGLESDHRRCSSSSVTNRASRVAGKS